MEYVSFLFYLETLDILVGHSLNEVIFVKDIPLEFSCLEKFNTIGITAFGLLCFVAYTIAGNTLTAGDATYARFFSPFPHNFVVII